MTSPISRRALLRGVFGGAAVSVALPALEIFLDGNGTAYAGGTAFPKRFGFWFWGNGVIPSKWVPATTGADWEMTELLAPIARHRDVITLVSGMAVKSQNTVPHGSGPAGLLSGTDLVGGEFAGPSLDQIIAEQIGGETRFRSIETGVQRSTDGLSRTGPHGTNPPETNPMALYQRLFGEGFRAPGETTEPDPRLALRRSVLSAVTDQTARLRRRLGRADQRRLDAHLEGVRSIENQILRLEMDPPSYEACMRPEAPMMDYPDVEGRPQVSAISRVMSDMMAMALACDQTRVFSTMFSQPVNNTLFGTAAAGHHQLTHDEPGEQPQVTAILQLIMGELDYFLGRLRDTVEGDGTLLDHMVVLCTTDCSLGRTHELQDYPIILAGSADGVIRNGIHFRSPSADNACRVSLTLLQLFDETRTEFGDGPARATDALGDVLV